MKIAAGNELFQVKMSLQLSFCNLSHISHFNINDTLISEMKDLISLMLAICEFQF
jgi:hypothetical protein